MPEALIARHSLSERRVSRLLMLDGPTGVPAHRQFAGLLDYLHLGDLMVFNNTRMIPARLFGQKESGGKLEALVECVLDQHRVLTHIRASKTPKLGTRILVEGDGNVEVLQRHDALFKLAFVESVLPLLERVGHMPLPPYIDRPDDAADHERYQTVYAQRAGAVAALAVGLHFNEALFEVIRARGVGTAFVTLHVNAGTFRPTRVERIEDHVMHRERLEVGQDVMNAVPAYRIHGGRVVTAGTTSVYSLESAAHDGELKPFSGDTDILIFLNRPFHVVDVLVTNFHLPESILLVLVSALASYLEAMVAYAAVATQGCRFFSHGSVMFITHNPASHRPEDWSMSFMNLELLAIDDRARRDRLTSPRGVVETPAFMPVGTYSTAKGMLPCDIEGIGAQTILGNTSHLWLCPGTGVIQRRGNLHGFMRWKGPILTDSGDFQVFNLGVIRKIEEKNVASASPVDSTKVFMGPEESMAVQRAPGSDIVIILDECTPCPADHEVAKHSMRLSSRWAKRLKIAHSDNPSALFGIVQGDMHEDLRLRSLDGLQGVGFDGLAIDGLSVGEPKEGMIRVLDFLPPQIPTDKPHYLMGVGKSEDLVEGMCRGVDMFDCVTPTRNACNGHLFVDSGVIKVRSSVHKHDDSTLDSAYDCYICRHFSCACLCHLGKCGEMLGSILNATHNLRHYQRVMTGLREIIQQDTLAAFVDALYARRGLPMPPLDT